MYISRTVYNDRRAEKRGRVIYLGYWYDSLFRRPSLARQLPDEEDIKDAVGDCFRNQILLTADVDTCLS